MNHHRITTTMLVASALAFAACGTAPNGDGQPVGRPPAAVPSHVSAWQVYYDLTHPAPRAKPASDPASAWQVYYDLTHPPASS